MTARLLQAYRGGQLGTCAPGWWVHLDYDPDGVAELKATIPERYRDWDPDHQRWWVSEAVEAELLRVVPGLAAFKNQRALL